MTPLSRVQNYWYRQNVIKYFFALLLIGFTYRIVTVHQSQAGNISLQNYGKKQAYHQFTNPARRGDILDRNHNVLATDLILKKVNLDPTQLQAEFIPELAHALMISKRELQTAIDKKLSKKAGRKHLIVKKNIALNSPILDNIKQLKEKTCHLKICKKPLKKKICRIQNKQETNFFTKTLTWLNIKKHKSVNKICEKQTIRGVNLQEDIRRYYPKSAALAPLLGRINHQKVGKSGIESEFETVLSGQNKITKMHFNKNKNDSYFNTEIVKKLKNGQDIILTIDSDIQFHTYNAIKKSVNKHQANSGSAIVLSANGEILALANYPADDPNNRRVYNAKNYRNYVLSDKVDPGSTIKPFTILLALEKGKINATEDEEIDVTKNIGHIKADGKYKKLTVQEILQKSHNLGTVKIAERLSKKTMFDAWKKLGFGQPVGLMPSIETAGTLRHFSTWSKADKRALSFGYGPMTTNLAQLSRAYLVFANQGSMPNLKLIKNTHSNHKMTPVFSPKSTAKIAKLLDGVVSKNGSGYRAQIKGYSIAGKTGTAEMVIDGTYSKTGAKRTFFAGFAPVKKPKYIVVVRLDHPKKCYTSYNPTIRDKCQGSNSSAMVFKDILQNVLSFDDNIVSQK